MNTLSTPALWVDLPNLERNLAHMQQRADALKVALRPHVKTHKCLPIAERQRALGARGLTVSTLAEAEYFFAAGHDDLLIAVAIAPVRYARAARLRASGARLQLLVDGPAAAQALGDWAAEQGVHFRVLIEIDADGHRAGLAPDSPRLLQCAERLVARGQAVAGVLVHAGGSYRCASPGELVLHAEQERSAAVEAAEVLRAAGFEAPVVSVGSTPTALSAAHLNGVTELRAGVYAFHDLVMLGTGCCTRDDLALAVRTSVIGHAPERRRLFVDAGWMALSRDRGTATQARDWGYGAVRDARDGRWLEDLHFVSANQEHGVIEVATGTDIEARFPIGAALDIAPNHACATVAQHARLHVGTRAEEGGETWELAHGW